MTAHNYIRLDDPNQIEPGDSVYEVVRFGQNETDVKYNEMRVMSIERKAVVALRSGGPRGSRPIKVPFSALVIRAPDVPSVRTPVVSLSSMPLRGHVVVRTPNALEVVQAPSPKPDAFAAYIEITQGVLQELRLELDGLDDTKGELEAERVALETEHRQAVERLNDEIRKLNHQHHKRDAALTDAIEDVEQRRAPLQERVDNIQTMLSTVAR